MRKAASKSLGDNFFKSVIETIRAPLLVLDKDLRAILANRSFCAVFGGNAEEVRGKPFDELIGHPSNIKALRKLLEQVLPGKKGFSQFEALFDIPSRGKRTFLLNGSQVQLRGQEKRMILLAMDDITEQKIVEEVLKKDKERSQEMLDLQIKLNRSKRLADIGTLAATVAHELRNPLAAISFAVTNIRRKTTEPALEKHLFSIEKKVMESDQIINNLLYYSHMKPPKFESINIANVLADTLDEFAHQQARKLLVARKFDTLRDVVIKADPLHLREIFLNILNNACDSIPEESGKIEALGADEGDFVSVVIKDNGVGIEKEHLERVCDPFFTTKAKGTGLGLPVCCQLIELHGGTISIKSEPKKGTSISIRLPKEQAAGR